MPKPDANKDNPDENNKEGYPLYPPKDDIYNRFREEKDIDPEDLKNIKGSIPDPEAEEDEVKELGDDVMGGDLDVPGSDLDDEEEEAGNEDEENNYYSIGGDNHHDLEDNNGEELNP